MQQTRLKCLYYKKLFRVPVIFPLLRMRQELVQPVCVLIYVNFARILKFYLFDVICYTHVHLLWQLNLLSYSYLFLILQDFDVIRRPRNFSQQENVLRNNPQFHFSSFLFSIMCVFMCAVWAIAKGAVIILTSILAQSKYVQQYFKWAWYNTHVGAWYKVHSERGSNS